MKEGKAIAAFTILPQCEIFASSGFNLQPSGLGMPFSGEQGAPPWLVISVIYRVQTHSCFSL